MKLNKICLVVTTTDTLVEYDSAKELVEGLIIYTKALSADNKLVNVIGSYSCVNDNGKMIYYMAEELMNDYRGTKNGYASTGDGNARYSKPVYQFTKGSLTPIRYSAISTASELNGVLRDRIADCCKGKARTAGGFIWAYADKEDT